MSNSPGFFVTFEGVDFSGKTTQLRMLDERLTKSMFKVVSVREPGSTQLGAAIREILLQSAYPVGIRAQACLFNAARAQLCKHVIIPELEVGKTVLCDRFYDSTLAYQGSDEPEFQDYLHYINAYASYGLVPDVTFFLHISEDVYLKRMRNVDLDRMEVSLRRKYKAVMDSYEVQASRNPFRYAIIDGSLDKETVHSRIVKEFDERFFV